MASVAVLGVVAVVTAVGWLWTAVSLRSVTVHVLADSRTMADTEAIRLGMINYRRLRDVHFATGEPEAATAAVALRADIEARFDAAARRVTDPTQRALLDAASSEARAWFDKRDEAERMNDTLGSVVAMSRPRFRQLGDSLDKLHALNARELRQAHADALALATVAKVVASCAGVLLLLVVLATAFVASRLLIRPALDTHAAIQRFRAGDLLSRAPREGAAELREVASAFNDMADDLQRQRLSQFAFLAGVVHDLRNPLSALQLGVDSLRTERHPADDQRTLDLVERQLGRLATMVDDLLDATRIEAGDLELHREDMDLRAAVETVAELYAPTSTIHALELELPDRPVLIDADPARIEQVLANLVSNAIKYSPDGGSVTVRVDRDDDGPFAEVRDQGIGIPPDEIPRLFEPFRRGAPDIAHGAGLGLSVVCRIVKAHGGSIQVESAPGSGSTFRVRCPAAEADVAGDAR